MYHRGWFLVDVESEALSQQLIAVLQRFGVVRVRPLDGEVQGWLREPGRVAGVIMQVDESCLLKLEHVRAVAPRVAVLGLLRTADAALINALQQRDVEVAVQPVHAPNLVSFAQRALSASFLPHDGVARWVSHLARTRGLSAREVQLLTYALGSEPRARVRRRLGIAENTLKTQIKALLRKCNERNLDALAKNVLRAALLGPEPYELAEPVAPWLPRAAQSA
jgi:DNA-binding NarL/FixJ family response regulator